ncbi:GAF domain-containing protein [Spinactinospora alkalitolerans]|uniref:GAF domain-containing protein n=1 Tax=Spinactinospora alkalitolerans TaxID=687207 RepID=A0A852TZ45_9ACTN|nr:GAF and ANTAR domain-containing protein [Spinactinospora alkalitolerans]NYE47244.1 GAF domain-containing protein [Spinactinospora alkalitolerans]
MPFPEDHVSSAEVRARILRDIFAEPDVHDGLHQIADLAVRTITGCDHAGIALVEDHSAVHTPVFTDEVVRRCDALQHGLGQGPCLDPAWPSASVHLADTSSEPRWPRYAEAVRELGIGSTLTFLLFTSGSALGALTLYASRSGAFSAADQDVGMVLSAQAATALADARRITNLHRALESRETIGQAQGILMERHRITADQAWQRLRTASQDLNVKLAKLAEEITRTGEEPWDGPAPGTTTA